MPFYRVVYILLLVSLYWEFFEATAQCNVSISSTQTSGCSPLTVQFSDQTPVAQVVSRQWDFGNGQTSTSVVFPALFNEGVNGDTSYIVSLTVNCINGSVVTLTDTVNVFAKPNVDFTVDDTLVCAISDTVCFTNLSDQGTGFSYNWSFGDLNTSTAFNPVMCIFRAILTPYA